MLQISYVVAMVAGLEIVTDGVEVDAGLGEEGLIFLEAVNEVPLMRLLLPSTRWLRGDNPALDVSLDAVGARLLLVAANLPLLTQDT